MREWEQIIPEEERRIYEKAGYKGRDSFGRNPALLVIDVITGFTGTKPMPVLDAIDEFPTSCGQVAWDALPKIQQLLHACRDADVPVIYSTSDPDFKAAFGNATKRGVDATVLGIAGCSPRPSCRSWPIEPWTLWRAFTISSRARVGSRSSCCSAMPRSRPIATSCCWTPSCRLRSIRRRSVATASRMS